MHSRARFVRPPPGRLYPESPPVEAQNPHDQRCYVLFCRDGGHKSQTHFLQTLEKIRLLTEEKKNYAALRAQSYIDEHYAEPLTLQSISDALHISPYYLCHIFKCSLDTSVMDYLNTCRIHAAKGLLRTETMSVKDIALAVGFSDPNYFCRVFKRTTGVTPSAYKRLES